MSDLHQTRTMTGIVHNIFAPPESRFFSDNISSIAGTSSDFFFWGGVTAISTSESDQLKFIMHPDAENFVIEKHRSYSCLWTKMFAICLICTAFTTRRNGRIESSVVAIAIPSVRLSVRLSVCHTPVLCQNDCT